VRTVGVLSYAMYLVHTTVIRLVEQVTESRLALGVLSAVATLVVSYLLHRTVEVPFIEWRKRLRAGRSKAPSTPIDERSAPLSRR
jgi:peptidoglycan/LPS O-acetylase OafA/YrhL